MDCNDCAYLMVTENQQEEIKQCGFGFAPHICTKFDKRVFHRVGATRTRNHSSYLHPCEECEKENNNEAN